MIYFLKLGGGLRASLLFFLSCLFSFSGVCFAECLDIPSDQIIGENHYIRVQKGDTFVSIAKKYGVGYEQLSAANPRVDGLKPLENAVVLVPSQIIIPPVKHEGIVINLSQMRLFYFPPKSHKVCTYPVGIGQVDWQTPVGHLRIIQKIKNPVWTVPDSIMAYRKARGEEIQKHVPSGPKNPLGYFALRLSKPTYLIHGTNEDDSIGRRSSAGCVHLFNQDIEDLFHRVHPGVSVNIINMPFLFAKKDGVTFFSAFPLLKEQKDQWTSDDIELMLRDGLKKMSSNESIDLALSDALSTISEPTGVVIQLR